MFPDADGFGKFPEVFDFISFSDNHHFCFRQLFQELRQRADDNVNAFFSGNAPDGNDDGRCFLQTERMAQFQNFRRVILRFLET